MTKPDDKKKSPVDRFHRILSSGQKKREEIAETRKSAIVNLPKAGPVREAATPAQPGSTWGETTGALPGGPRLGREGLLPTFWTAASVISLAVNAILLIALIGLMRSLGGLNATGLGTGLLGGLYTNFERMDRAHIRTNIPVQTGIPLNMSIPVQTTTVITLAQEVSIKGAHVKINTPLFNIDAPADVTLPAGTALNVILNFTVPVQAEVPVTLNVPVDIAMQDTELHAAITGLQTTIQPLYCIVDPAALSLSGAPVCR